MGCVVRNGEWVQTKYRQAVRDRFAGPLGLEALHVLYRFRRVARSIEDPRRPDFRVGSSKKHVPVALDTTPTTLALKRSLLAPSAAANWRGALRIPLPVEGKTIREETGIA